MRGEGTPTNLEPGGLDFLIEAANELKLKSGRMGRHQLPRFQRHSPKLAVTQLAHLWLGRL